MKQIKASELNRQYTWWFTRPIDMGFVEVVNDSSSEEEELRLLDFEEFQASIRGLVKSHSIKEWNEWAEKLRPFTTKYGSRRINTYHLEGGEFNEIIQDICRLR